MTVVRVAGLFYNICSPLEIHCKECDVVCPNEAAVNVIILFLKLNTKGRRRRVDESRKSHDG